MKVLLTALNASYTHTNLAVRLLKASMPENGGALVEIMEKHINLPFDRVLRDVAMANADVYGFSCYIWNIDYILKLCRSLRRARPGAVIFLGGPEVAYRAKALLEDEPDIDYCLFGEGEIVFPAFISALSGGKAHDVPGVWGRDACGVPVCTPAPEALPPEMWPDAYAKEPGNLRDRLVYVETSRGCPFSCQYCLSGGDKVRALPADEAVRRLLSLADKGTKVIKLVDRTFNFDRKRARDIWRALIEHALATGARPVYHCEIAAHLVEDEDIALLSRAPKGLFQFEIGIQSSNPHVLQTVRRGVGFDAAREAVIRLVALGNIHIHVDLIAGLPGEDMPSFAKSFNETYALGAEQLQLGFLKLLHGSGLRRDARDYALNYAPDAPYEILSTDSMSFGELSFLHDVERTLGYYGNSHMYDSALSLLLREKTPFDVFASLARAMRARGYLDVELGEKARAEALIACAGEWVERPLLAALVCHDLLLKKRRGELPTELAFCESEPDRALLRARFHPVRGQSLRHYEYDLRAWLDQGELRRTPCAAFYDEKGHAEWI